MELGNQRWSRTPNPYEGLSVVSAGRFSIFLHSGNETIPYSSTRHIGQTASIPSVKFLLFDSVVNVSVITAR